LKNILKLLILTGLILVVALSGCLGGDDGNDGNDGDDGADNNTPDSASNFSKNVTLSDNNSVLNFEFTTNPSTGYGWTLTANQTGLLNEVASDVTTSRMPGAPGVQIWSFEGNQAGVVALNFIYERSFEENSTVENLTYVIEVKDDMSMIILSVSSPYVDILRSKETTLENNSTALKLVFGSNPTTGYDWTVSVVPAGVLNMTKDDFNAPTTGLVGASGTHIFEFEGLKAGSANVTLSYLRTFEADSTIENAVYGITVNENKTLEIVSISYDTL